MRTSRRLRFEPLIGTIVIAIGAALPAAAQDIPVYRMTRIVVTPDEEFFGPKPDTVIEIPEGSPGRAPTLDEALKGAPGVAMARTGGPGQPAALFFRGSPAEHTLVLVDGVEVNDAGAPAGAFDFSTLDMNMVERIEIYKGPQAMRFGSGAMGGVINVRGARGFVRDESIERFVFRRKRAIALRVFPYSLRKRRDLGV
jgi:outer membrane cobalamin receptor